jgi:hypothetical protein
MAVAVAAQSGETAAGARRRQRRAHARAAMRRDKCAGGDAASAMPNRRKSI